MKSKNKKGTARRSTPDWILGFDVGGTKFSVCLGNTCGKIRASLRQPADVTRGPADAIQRLLAMGEELLQREKLSRHEIRAIGIAAPGPLDVKTGELISQPNAPGWRRVPLRQAIENHFQRPSFLENDANACAYAEWRYGSGHSQEHRSLLYLTFSTGIGAGLILEGQLYRGATGDAGEVGHQTLDPSGPLCGCGQRGCFEAFCGGNGIARQMREAVKTKPRSLLLKLAGGNPAHLRVETLLAAARQRDPLALELFDRVGFRAAQGMGNLINILNPEILALGTIPTYCGKYFFRPLQKYLPQFAWPRPLKAAQIVPCALGQSIGNLGAIGAALMQESTRSCLTYITTTTATVSR